MIHGKVSPKARAYVLSGFFDLFGGQLTSALTPQCCLILLPHEARSFPCCLQSPLQSAGCPPLFAKPCMIRCDRLPQAQRCKKLHASHMFLAQKRLNWLAYVGILGRMTALYSHVLALYLAALMPCILDFFFAQNCLSHCASGHAGYATERQALKKQVFQVVGPSVRDRGQICTCLWHATDIFFTSL